MVSKCDSIITYHCHSIINRLQCLRLMIIYVICSKIIHTVTKVKCEIISCSNLISRLFNKRICLIKTSVHFFRRLIIIIDHLTMNVCSKYNSHIRIHSCSRCIVCRLRTACQNYISSLCFLCHSRYTVT